MTDPVVMARDLVGQWQCEWRDRVGIEAEVDVGQAIDLMDRIAAALAQREARVAALEKALEPFRSGGEWGKWKAWLVEGAQLCGNDREDGLNAARQITRWQVAVEAAFSPGEGG